MTGQEAIIAIAQQLLDKSEEPELEAYMTPPATVRLGVETARDLCKLYPDAKCDSTKDLQENCEAVLTANTLLDIRVEVVDGGEDRAIDVDLDVVADESCGNELE